MPAQESSDRHPSTEPSRTHTWLSLEGRHLEIKAGKPLLHRFCTTCRRNFVCDLSSGRWHAVFPRTLDFDYLNQVSEQWLKETCPRQYLTSDAAVMARPPQSSAENNLLTYWGVAGSPSLLGIMQGAIDPEAAITSKQGTTYHRLNGDSST